MKKNTLANLCICSCLALVVFLNCGFIFGNKEKKLDRLVEKGNVIVRAVAAYYHENGAFPTKVSQFYPKYFETEVEKRESFMPNDDEDAVFVVDGEEFLYFTIPNNSDTQWSADSIRYGFQLTAMNYGRFTRKSFIYHPSERYFHRRFRTVKKIHKGWAVVVQYDNFGNPNDNTILSDDDLKQSVYEREPNADPFKAEYYKTRISRAKQNIKASMDTAEQSN